MNNIPKVVSGECPTCKGYIEVAAPDIIIFNDVLTSVVSVPHTQGIVCLGCGTYYALYIMGCQLNMALAPGQKPEAEDNKVIPFAAIPGLKGN